MSPSRSPYWDNWKGLAIIAVVTIHATWATELFPPHSFNWQFGIWLRQLVNFAVPMFLALAGYFAATAREMSPRAYYNRRIWRILAPYAVWTLIYLAIRTPGTLPSTHEIIRGFLFGTGIGIGYFVVVLLQFVAITPLLARLKSIRAHIAIICAATLLGLAFSYHIRLQPSGFFSTFPGNSLIFLFWYPFYHVGLLIRSRSFDPILQNLNPAFLWSLLILTLTFSVLEGYFWANRGHYEIGVEQIKFSSFAVSLVLFLIAVSYSGRRSWIDGESWLTFLGRNSYAIYLIHLLPMSLFRASVGRSGPLFEAQPAYIVAAVLVSLLSCTMFIAAVRTVLPDRMCRIVLG